MPALARRQDARAPCRPGERAATRRRACSPASSVGSPAPRSCARRGSRSARRSSGRARRAAPRRRCRPAAARSGPRAASRSAPGGHGRRQAPDEVERAQRERDPAAGQADAPVAGARCRSSPSSARSSARMRGSTVGWSRWLPRSTRTPATVVAARGAADAAGALDQRHPVAGRGRRARRRPPRPGPRPGRAGRSPSAPRRDGRTLAAATGYATVGAPRRTRAPTRAPGGSVRRPDDPRAHRRRRSSRRDRVDGVVAVVLDASTVAPSPPGAGDEPLRADHHLHGPAAPAACSGTAPERRSRPRRRRRRPATKFASPMNSATSRVAGQLVELAWARPAGRPGRRASPRPRRPPGRPPPGRGSRRRAVAPIAASIRRTSSRSSARSGASRFEKGSSSRITEGRGARARARGPRAAAGRPRASRRHAVGEAGQARPARAPRRRAPPRPGSRRGRP